MLLSSLSPEPSLLRFESATVETDQLIIEAVAVASEAKCPRCRQASRRIHSPYSRRPWDLPCMGLTVHLSMIVRRFWCLSPICSQRIFTERLGDILSSYARKRTRLLKALGSVVISVGGEAGSRLASQLSMGASSSTLLRLIGSMPMPDFATPEVLGVDDWALHKGQTYATVLVDLKKGLIIDLLPDTKSDTLSTWLRENHGVRIISRDRAGAYAKGGRDGSPEAEQVADRWHLVHNLGDALQRLLRTYRDETEAAAKRVINDQPETTPSAGDPSKPRRLNKEQVLSQQRYEARKAKYDKVKRLAEEGQSVSGIGREMGMVPRTVKKYLKEKEPRRWGGRRTPSTVEPYDKYLRERWNEGCENSRRLWDELKEHGFEGSHGAVKRYVSPWRGCLPSRVLSKAQRELQNMSPRQASWLLIQTRHPLSDERKAFRAALFELSPDLEQVSRHVKAFQDILSGRSKKTLSWWMEQAKKLGSELRSFVVGLKRVQKTPSPCQGVRDLQRGWSIGARP